MATVLLIRHGIAEDTGRSDADRPLSAEGWMKTRAAMAGLVKRGYVPSRGVSSPFRRAAETLACLREAAPGGFPVACWEGLEPGGHPSRAADWLLGELAGLASSDTLALVSHEPFLSGFIQHLVRRPVEVKKASCTVLRWDGRSFRFAVHFTPAELRRT